MKLLLLSAILSAAAPLAAFDLQGLDLNAVRELVPSAVEIPAAPAARAANQHLWMSVRNNPSFKEADASDWGARIEARVRETYKDSYSVNLRADADYGWASVRRSNSFYGLSGGGLNLNMSCGGTSCSVSGSVWENGKTSFVSANLSRRFDAWSYNVFGSGLNLYTDKNSINGSYDPDRVSKKAVAAVAALLLTLQVEASLPPAAKSAAGTERVWLSVRQGWGWNTVEALDPWARIEVGLRKVFDREYDAELAVEGRRQWGRVSGFFPREYTLRAGRGDLRMREWAGSWRVEGRVETPAGEQAISVELRERFGDGSFYAWQQGLNINIDRNGLSGDYDPALFPKEALAAIEALALAWQQDNPVPGSPR